MKQATNVRSEYFVIQYFLGTGSLFRMTGPLIAVQQSGKSMIQMSVLFGYVINLSAALEENNVVMILQHRCVSSASTLVIVFPTQNTD